MTDDLRIQLQEQARQAQFWRAEAERWQRLWHHLLLAIGVRRLPAAEEEA